MPDEQEVPAVISLSDDEMAAVERAARPLAPEARGPFLEQLGRALVGRREVGPGELFRILSALQPPFAPQPPRKRVKAK
jgi:hypothetical protein